MSVKYELTLEDLTAFNRHHSLTSKRARQRLRRIQAFGVVTSLVLAAIWTEWTGLMRVLFSTVMSLFWVFGYPAYYRWAIKRHTRKTYSEGANRGLLGNHSISIDAEGVTEKTSVGETRTDWSGIEKIDEDGQYVYLYVSVRQAHVIPKKAFTSTNDVEKFLQLAHAYRLNGTSSTSPQY